MKDSKGSFNVLLSIEKHIAALKPLLPKQAIVAIGEYPIKTMIKEPTLSREGTLPIFIEKSSDDIYKWVPKAFDTHFIMGFEDADIDTHFWYEVLPTLNKDTSVMESLKKKSTEKLRGAIIFASVWDGVGSAAVPSLIGKFNAQKIDTLSIAVLPSKIQPTDAHFNAYATLQMCQAMDSSTVLLLGRDELENYEGVDRKGVQIKGNQVVNYMLNLFLSKELLVEEIAELSRTFNVKLFSALAVSAASYRVYGSLDNMLNTALLKPLLSFDLSSAKLLYVLLRMPMSLKEKIPRVQIELEITNWFKKKTSLQSIHISEPVYTEDMSDRIDAVLFIGGFDISGMFADLDSKVEVLKNRAVEKGYMTVDWQLPFKVEEEQKAPEAQTPQETPKTLESQQTAEPPQTVMEEPKTVVEAQVPMEAATALVSMENVVLETESTELPQPVAEEEPAAVAEPEKPKRTRRTKKAAGPKKEETPVAASGTVEVTESEKPKRVRGTEESQAAEEAVE